MKACGCCLAVLLLGGCLDYDALSGTDGPGPVDGSCKTCGDLGDGSESGAFPITLIGKRATAYVTNPSSFSILIPPQVVPMDVVVFAVQYTSTGANLVPPPQCEHSQTLSRGDRTALWCTRVRVAADASQYAFDTTGITSIGGIAVAYRGAKKATLEAPGSFDTGDTDSVVPPDADTMLVPIVAYAGDGSATPPWTAPAGFALEEVAHGLLALDRPLADPATPSSFRFADLAGGDPQFAPYLLDDVLLTTQ